MRIVFLSLLILVPSLVSAQEVSRIDPGLDLESDRMQPIFVMFKDQLFAKFGDLDRFHVANEKLNRTDMRTKVVKELKDRHKKAMTRELQALLFGLAVGNKEKGIAPSIASPKPFWIVNGFACDATPSAIRRIAALDSVDFIYLQRGRPTDHQHRKNRPTTTKKNVQTILNQVLSKYVDDSDKPLKEDALVPGYSRMINADKAHARGITGKGVVVALNDSGLMYEAAALTRALWKNPGETLNGKDDDGNGYVDDIFGYDVASDSPLSIADGNNTSQQDITHGSMCGGIIAGRAINKSKFQAGVAPRAKLMVIRGSMRIEALQYAVDNGAHIMNMSFSHLQPLGEFASVLRTAHEHAFAAGLLQVTGSGNNAGRIGYPGGIPCVLTVGGIAKNGATAGPRGQVHWNSRHFNDFPPGTGLLKPNLCAFYGRFAVWSRPMGWVQGQRLPTHWQTTIPVNKSAALISGPTGNSFSGPQVAGVAALLLSAKPEMTSWELSSLIQSTTTDVGDKGYDVATGRGLVNAAAGLDAILGKVKPKPPADN